MSHSPGPWKWGAEGLRHRIFDRDGMAVLDEFEGVDEEADRTLIAAAPELLAMLRELECIWRDSDDGGGPECPACETPRSHTSDCRLAALLARFT